MRDGTTGPRGGEKDPCFPCRLMSRLRFRLALRMGDRSRPSGVSLALSRPDPCRHPDPCLPSRLGRFWGQSARLGVRAIYRGQSGADNQSKSVPHRLDSLPKRTAHGSASKKQSRFAKPILHPSRSCSVQGARWVDSTPPQRHRHRNRATGQAPSRIAHDLPKGIRSNPKGFFSQSQPGARIPASYSRQLPARQPPPRRGIPRNGKGIVRGCLG